MLLEYLQAQTSSDIGSALTVRADISCRLC